MGLSFDWIVFEGEAAFYSEKKYLKKSDEEVTLIIDFGEKHLDFTAIDNGLKISNEEWTNEQLGTECIVHAILDSYRANDYEGFTKTYLECEKMLNETGQTYINIDDILYSRCRRIKEQAYNHCLDLTSIDFNLSEYTGNLRDYRIYRFEFDFSMSEISKDYRKAVKSEIERYKTKIEIITHKKVSNVILTGEGGMMLWVHNMILGIFNDSTLRLIDINPWYIVAKGVAEYCLEQLNEN